MSLTAGIDVGSNAVKVGLVSVDETGPTVHAVVAERIRKRDISTVVQGAYERALERSGLSADQVDYVASTGAGELVDFRRGHFYGMTSHARGAHFLDPEARTALDLGALHARAIRMDERSRVLSYKMTAQCASGSGQFIENIARYLGVPLAQVGSLSLQSQHPELPSGICAVLAETDVINMVSRGITAPDILKGIHLSIAHRLVRLLAAAKAESPVLVTGGLAANEGMIDAIREKIAGNGLEMEIRVHDDSIHAGALGAALWGAWRVARLNEKARLTTA
ncbi:MAG: benzoyl-CoA reductase subunit D [Acidobacteriota bacterium]